MLQFYLKLYFLSVVSIRFSSIGIKLDFTYICPLDTVTLSLFFAPLRESFPQSTINQPAARDTFHCFSFRWAVIPFIPWTAPPCSLESSPKLPTFYVVCLYHIFVHPPSPPPLHILHIVDGPSQCSYMLPPLFFNPHFFHIPYTPLDRFDVTPLQISFATNVGSLFFSGRSALAWPDHSGSFPPSSDDLFARKAFFLFPGQPLSLSNSPDAILPKHIRTPLVCMCLLAFKALLAPNAAQVPRKTPCLVPKL